MSLIENKTGETKIGFAVLLKFFQNEARFPSHKYEVPKAVIAYIAKQIYFEPELYAQYDWTGRSITYHRTQIREFFGFREDTIDDAQNMIEWLCQHVLHRDHEMEHLKEHVYRRFRELKIVPPTPDRIERLIRSSIHTYEETFFQTTFQKLPSITLAKLDSLIDSIAYLETDDSEVTSKDNGQLSFKELKADPGRAGVDSVLKEVNKLRTIRKLKRYYEVVWKAKNFQDMMTVKTLMYTGVRVSELINIKLADIDFHYCQNRINKGKGSKDRIVPFPQSFKELLAMHADSMKKEAGCLFVRIVLEKEIHG